MDGFSSQKKTIPSSGTPKRNTYSFKERLQSHPRPLTNLLQECEWFLKAMFSQIRGQKTAQCHLQVQPVEKHTQQNNCYKCYGLIISKHHKQFYVGFTHLY